MKFSDDEAALLLAIKLVPNRTIQEYSTSMGIPFIKALHAHNALKEKAVIVNTNDALSIEEAALLNITCPEETLEPEVVPENAEIAKEDTMAKQYRVLTQESLYADVCAQSPKGKTAGEYAKEYGCKGTSLNWHFRKLIQEGKVEKRLDKYFKAGPEAQCISVPVPPAPEPVAEKTILEKIAEPVQPTGPRSSHVMTARSRILGTTGEWTANEFKSHVDCEDLDEGSFEIAFAELHKEKRFNARELTDTDYRYTTYDAEVNEDFSYTVAKEVSDFDITRNVTEYIGRMRKQSYALADFVKALGIRHDLILRVFQSSIRYMYDDDEQTLTIRGYNLINELCNEDLVSFVEGGAKATAFMKRFNLDPSQKDKLINVLRTLKIADYDKASDFLYPQKKTADVIPFKPADTEPAEVVVEPVANAAEVEQMLDAELPENTVELAESQIVYDAQNVSIGIKGPCGPNDSGLVAVRGDAVHSLTQDEIMRIGNHDANPIEVPEKEPNLAAEARKKIAKVAEETSKRFPNRKREQVDTTDSEEAIQEYMENLDKIMPRSKPETVKATKEGDRVEFDTKSPVKTEWAVVLELLAERHKKCPTTKRVLHEIKEHLQQ